MTTTLGIDVAWARPSVAQIKAIGARFVCRYFSTDSDKNLTAAEVTAYAAAGLGTVTVWETTKGRATDGYAAGQADARAAEAQRKAVGLPATHVHHFAVDEDTNWSSVAPYLAGAASVIGQARTGVYGSYRVVEGAYAAGYRYLWQTAAWSHNQWSAHATIRQTGGTTLGGDADWDTAMTADYGQHPRPLSPEDDMPTAQEIAAAVMEYQVDDPTQAGTQYTSVKSMLWYTGANAAQANATIRAQSVVIETLAAKVSSGEDAATIVAAVQQAIADATVHVQVDVTGTPTTS